MSDSPLNDYANDFSNLRPLPDGWAWSTFGEITENFDGSRIPLRASDRKFQSGEYPYYGASGVIDSVDDFIFDGDYLLVAEDGANLLSRSSPIAFVAIGKFWVNNHAHVVQTHGGIPLKFLEYYLAATNLQFFCSGTAQPKLNKRNLNRIPIPIPPLEEQSRIVSKIDELFSDLDSGVAALDRAYEKLRRYRASLLKSAMKGGLTDKWRESNSGVEPASKLLARIIFERRQRWEQHQLTTYESKGKKPPKNWQSKYKEPATPSIDDLPALPQGWCWATLEQLAAFQREIAYGVLQPGKQFDGGTELIRVGDIKNGTIDNTTLKEIDPKIADKYKRTVLRGGEVLLTVVGAIGRSAVVPDSLVGANVARAVAVIPLVPFLSADFLRLTLATSSMRNRLTQKAHEVARKTLNLEDVRRVVVPVAPLEEQEEIVREIHKQFASIENSETTIVSNIEKQKTTRQSILSRAFKGELVPQRPNDQPASELLKRIGEQRELEKKRPKPSRSRGAKMTNEIRPILEVLSENPDGITPERLYAIGGFENADLEDGQIPIDVFYAALKDVQSQIVEEKPDGGEAFRWPTNATVSLKAKQ